MVGALDLVLRQSIVAACVHGIVASVSVVNALPRYAQAIPGIEYRPVHEGV